MNNIFLEGKDPLQVLWDSIENLDNHDCKEEKCAECYNQAIDE